MSRLHLAATLPLACIIWIGVTSARPAGELRDYGSFIASGRAAADGGDPYGIHPLTFHVVLPGFDVYNPNLNPPVSLPAFQALDRLEPRRGFVAWWVFSLACYALTLWLLARTFRPRAWLVVLWAVALAGFWDTLALGQIYLPLVLAASGAWILLERGRLVAAGVLIGLVVAVKPNFTVWPAMLLLSGHTAVAAAAAATCALLWSLPLVLYGPAVYHQWFELVLSDTGRAAFLTNASLAGLTQRLDLPLLGLVASVVLLGALAAWAAWRRPDARRASTFGLLGGIIASPIAWVHYTLFLLPIFFTIRWSALTAVAAVLLVVPVSWVLSTLDAPAWQQLTLGSTYNWAVLACFVALVRNAREHGAADRREQSARHFLPSTWRPWTSSRTTSTTPS